MGHRNCHCIFKQKYFEKDASVKQKNKNKKIKELCLDHEKFYIRDNMNAFFRMITDFH